ncbi:hypothetical protein BESEP9_00139 [Staphylococcus phage vB_SepM_BE09]|uniref:Uncharacterized protein n=5 Tax=Caudoviricetes TaxID=2731619 RepID=W5RAR8_9CAUD|nr:hypothetical protein FDH45_gp091 [Staphylococcus phage phiIBB-SEP1]ASN67750.1 hypothetical protein 7AX1_122 [uncultured Caudovirales phage]MDU7109208.1 hypothetical protein [Clostridium perfringens]QLF87290.1 hypothetical protein BESEP6_00136 [Staphylococcus phage vB_SepM_BE06]QLF87413.1 hypothetical protein BESEP7_00065 [Staphylococcus phage vB_SepM_BE07]QLF87697.1 hypothetical protein BESEP8_00149 [Staphylococcus phage vB_SepM_BE08]QLF87887.1 hypothetical protein BESEP9_00139 [Staphyloco
MSEVVFEDYYREFRLKVEKAGEQIIATVDCDLEYAPVIYDDGLDKVNLVADIKRDTEKPLSENELLEYATTIAKAHRAIEYFHKILYLKGYRR